MRYQTIISSPWALISALVLAAISVVALPRLQDWHDWSSYTQFVRHDRLYFEHLASDCDSFLKAHPAGSAGLVTDTHPGWFRVSLSEVALPESIRVLHPSYMLVSTNSLWVNCGSRNRLGWGFTWGHFEWGIDKGPRWALIGSVPYKCEKPLYVVEN